MVVKFRGVRLGEKEVPFFCDFSYAFFMKKSVFLLMLALAISSFVSCSGGTAAGKALDGVNQAGRAANSVRAITNFF